MDNLTKISTLEAYEEAKKGHAMMVFFKQLGVQIVNFFKNIY